MLYNELTFGSECISVQAFDRVLDHPGTTVVGAFSGGDLVAMVTLHLLPNVTWDARPYGLIENVITKSTHRNKGFGRLVLQQACYIAWRSDAYKVMLMTGQRRGAKKFYEAVGFSSEDKFAMVIRRN